MGSLQKTQEAAKTDRGRGCTKKKRENNSEQYWDPWGCRGDRAACGIKECRESTLRYQLCGPGFISSGEGNGDPQCRQAIGPVHGRLRLGKHQSVRDQTEQH